MSPVSQSSYNFMNMYYNSHPQHYYQHQMIPTPLNNLSSPSLSSTSTVSSSSTRTSSFDSSSNYNRLEQIQAKIELARNFYDDFEFCPVQCSSEVLEHRDRIHQRLYYSPQTSPHTSPSISSSSISSNSNSSSNSPTRSSTRRAIPIINPSNMTPVIPPQQQQQQQHTNNFMLRSNNNNTRSSHYLHYPGGVLVQ